jgi:hypothetical protein
MHRASYAVPVAKVSPHAIRPHLKAGFDYAQALPPKGTAKKKS